MLYGWQSDPTRVERGGVNGGADDIEVMCRILSRRCTTCLARRFPVHRIPETVSARWEATGPVTLGHVARAAHGHVPLIWQRE